MSKAKGVELTRSNGNSDSDWQRWVIKNLEGLKPRVNAAQNGDASAACDVFRALETAAPGAALAVAKKTVQQHIDILEAILTPWLGTNELAKQAIRVKADGDRKRLLGEHPSAVEELLVDEVVASWVLLAFARSQVALNIGAAPKIRDLTERTLGRAQRRHLLAIKMLATVRRLEIPAVQLNIGEKQINVVGNVHAGSVSRDDSVPGTVK